MGNADAVLVVAALAQRGGRVFLARRGGSGGDTGLWELPGGKVEAGEEPGDALLREIQEELGLEVFILGPARSYAFELRGRDFLFLVFPVELRGQPAFLAVHDSSSWFLPDEALALPLAPLDLPALVDWAASLPAPAGA